MNSPSRLGPVFDVGARSLSVVIGSNKLVGLAFWLAVIAALGALEAFSHLSRWPVPSAGDMVARYLGHPVVRAGAVALWLFAGYHLFSH